MRDSTTYQAILHAGSEEGRVMEARTLEVGYWAELLS